ncbi:MAG: SprT-like domain-containing protein [Lentimicrobiaceae bacterium]|jgi:hypothetical protein|nr:SprT-like domain-containing protein [Lentimicrobiaceae bacterium]
MPETIAKGKDILAKHVPIALANPLWEWLMQYNIRLKIKAVRKTKLGDYRPPLHDNVHQITVNAGLNPYQFLLTTVHEIAHAIVWQQHKNRVKPHGKEWKTTFAGLMKIILSHNAIPPSLQHALQKHMENPKAMGSTDVALQKEMLQYDAPVEGVLLEDVEPGGVFGALKGKTFQKHEKLRKRYRCMCLNNKKMYLFHPLTRVFPLD